MILELSLFALYLFVGPIFWILFAIGSASSRRRMMLVSKTVSPLPDPPPSATIIVPAKDEEGRIGQCLASALAQDYPDFRLLAVDDRSKDGTGKIMDELASRDPRMSVLHIADLPPGWTGKNHALHSAVQQVNSPWLLFIDSDVILQPIALSQTLQAAVRRRYDMLSLILKSETLGVWEDVLVPLASTAFGSVYMMGLSNSESNNYFFGNGQFMLFRRDIYDRIGGHEAVKSQYNEDMALARIMKLSGLRRAFSGVPTSARCECTTRWPPSCAAGAGSSSAPAADPPGESSFSSPSSSSVAFPPARRAPGASTASFTPLLSPALWAGYPPPPSISA